MANKIYVVGLGPGSSQYLTPQANAAISAASCIVGYQYYMQFAEGIMQPGAEVIDTGMKQERERASIAFEKARQGRTVAVISSGDSGIYGMAPLILEMQKEIQAYETEIEVVPGISAFQAAAAKLGAPMGHDFCCISLSDLLTPWKVIEQRIRAAAEADFAAAVYNPKSKGRYWQMQALKDIFLKYRHPGTPVGIVKQVGRPDESCVITRLDELDPETVDMFTIVLIGNSQTMENKGRMITPRGYYAPKNGNGNIGQDIMQSSFCEIESRLENSKLPLWHKWPLVHVIHTTADFEMEKLFSTSPQAAEIWHAYLSAAGTIITDVSMVASGIRKAALEKYGIQLKCYLSDPRAIEMARKLNITRTQAGTRLAAAEHPGALFAFGNAPTALIELCSLVRKGLARPAGIVAAPVGFVNVVESKLRVKSLQGISYAMVEGQKGGSNIAATIINSALSYPDAAEFMPGRMV
jgi:cobalt-factor III methyltransferase